MLMLWKKMDKHQITCSFMRMRTLADTNFSGFLPILRKELARHSRTNSSADNREALRNSQSGFSYVEIVEPHASKRKKYWFVVQFPFVMLSWQSKVPSPEVIMVFRCLQGDGGMVCGSLAGVGGFEAYDLVKLDHNFILCPDII
ncbi:hypothetical protein MKW92_050912 [Papaver armeniacum]|nr:hypothetical protein MKW92_050912 [Papaver armeniacum]